MKKSHFLFVVVFLVSQVQATVESVRTPFSQKEDATQIELKNDSFNDEGSPVYLQLGFVKSEKAGIWVQVPSTVKQFKVDYFRVLMGSEQSDGSAEIFFQMGVGQTMSAAIPADIENAAQITTGPYWNDIPAIGARGKLGCVSGGSYVGAAIEFKHDGAPSVYRDHDGLGNMKGNTLFAVPGGWNYSAVYGLTGDWVLRVIGHEAAAGEC